MVTFKRNDFNAFNDVSLIWACIEPTIQDIRGRNFIVKLEAYTSLNPGQQALLMFQMLYGHTSNGVEEFFSHLSYLLSNKGVWSQLKKGMQYFGGNDMVRILEKMDMAFRNLRTDEFSEATEQHSALIDINDESSTTIRLLNKSLSDTMPITIKLVATYIRNNTDEFMKLVD